MNNKRFRLRKSGLLQRVCCDEGSPDPVLGRFVADRAARSVQRVDAVPLGPGIQIQEQRAAGDRKVQGCGLVPAPRHHGDVHVGEVADECLAHVLLVVGIDGDPPAPALVNVGERFQPRLGGDQGPDLPDGSRRLPDVPGAVLREQAHVADALLDRAVVALLRVVGLLTVRQEPGRYINCADGPHVRRHNDRAISMLGVIGIHGNHRAAIVGVPGDPLHVVDALGRDGARVLGDAKPRVAAGLTEPTGCRHALYLRQDFW